MPLIVYYKGNDGQPYNITTVEIERVIRAAAATLFQLDPIKKTRLNWPFGPATRSELAPALLCIPKGLQKWRSSLYCVGNPTLS